MRRHSRNIAFSLLALSALLWTPLRAADLSYRLQELNLYEWTAVAPVVVTGTSLGENGRFVEFQVRHVLRGDVEPDTMIRVDLKQANRTRRRSDYPVALRMPEQTEYILVLNKPFVTKEGEQAFPFARGVRSAREIPLEGQQGVVDAVSKFLEIQDFKDDRVTWRRMGGLLEETNPLVIDTALQQIAKFRRGTLTQLALLRPLFEHPDPQIREGSLTVTAQIVQRNDGREEVPEQESLLAELIGLARRDGTVEVRVAATEALAAFGVGQVKPLLDEIAKSDPDQGVRYAAERFLLEYRKQQEAEAQRPRLQGASN